MDNNKITMLDIELSYSREVILITESGSKYSLLILDGEHNKELLVKKIDSKQEQYSYLIGIGTIRVMKAGPMPTAKGNKSYNYFINDMRYIGEYLSLESLIDGRIYYTNVNNCSTLNNGHTIKMKFLNSGQFNSIDESIVQSLGNSTKITDVYFK